MCLDRLCGFLLFFDSQEREAALQMTGMNVHTQLKKLRPCCSRGRKQL